MKSTGMNIFNMLNLGDFARQKFVWTESSLKLCARM